MKAFVIMSTAHRKSRQLHLEFDNFNEARYTLYKICRRLKCDVFMMDGNTGEILITKVSLSSFPEDDFISETYKELVKLNGTCIQYNRRRTK